MFRSLTNSIQNCNVNIVLQLTPNTGLKRTSVS